MNVALSKQSDKGGVQNPAGGRHLRAFTLIELLVVIAIIGILAGLAAPIVSRFGAGDKLSAGGRQLLDDLALARTKAMATRSTVYVVFLPDDILNINLAALPYSTNFLDRTAVTNLSGMTYSGYALFSERSVGDQPGSYTPRYLTKWKELPPGVVVHPYQFIESPALPIRTNYISGQYVTPFSYRNFPFPSAETPATFRLPYLAFNSMGQLVGGQNFRVQVSEARISRQRDPALGDSLIYSPLFPSVIRPDAPTVVFREWETNGINQGVNYTNVTIYAHEIEINWLTGRGKFLQPQIQ
ncbi:MAG TPA: prepilin-type N-terminal cleavage/methylation domain-containing protein [Verrucomicrobiae bacterium]